jgi:N-acetylmuramoyl-L-alanine amidase CwlA
VQDYVPVGNSNRPGTKLTASSITIHNTDNDSPHDWSGKNCPRVLRATSNGWSDLLANVQRNFKNLKPVDAPVIAPILDDHHSDPTA